MLAAIVRGIGGEVWFWLAGFGRLVRRYTIATLGSSAWLVVTAWQAWWNLFVLVAVPVVVFAGWRRVGPVLVRPAGVGPVVASPGPPLGGEAVADDRGQLRPVSPDH